MATILPARRMYEIEYEYGLWWEQAVGGSIYPTSEILLVSSTGDLGTLTEYARSAIQFETDVPAWATAGDLTEANAVLWMYLENYAHYSGIGNILIGNITAAWDMSSTQATMRTIAIGSWTSAISPNPNQEHGWVGFVLPTTSGKLRATNGICIKIETSYASPTSFKFLKDPSPVGRAYLSVDIDNAISGNATQRMLLDAEHLAALEGSSAKYFVSAEVLQEPIYPTRENIEVTLAGNSQMALVNRKTAFPESWNVQYPSLGSLTFSKAIDLHQYRGAIAELTLSMRIGQKPTVEIAKQRAILGKVLKSDVTQEIAVADPLKEALKMTPYLRDPILGMEGVNIDTESRPYALLQMLVNGAGIGWDRVRQEDFYWLLRRFGTIWDRMSVSTADLEDYTVGDFLKEVGAQFALCFSRGSSDEIVVWHPATYRPSMRVHEVNDKYFKETKYEKNASGDTYDLAKVNTTPASINAPLPTRLDARDKIYTITGLTGCFATSQVARYSLAMQLAQRMSCAYEIYDFQIDKRAAAWEDGDKLRITSDPERNNFVDRVFTIFDIKGSPTSGKYHVRAVRWPDSPAYQNTWKDTGLMGIWRFWAWDTWAKTGSNQSPIGTAGAMTATIFSSVVNADWRGMVGEAALTAPATFAPDSGGGSTKCDLVDLVLMIDGEQASDPTYGMGDDTWTIILQFRESGTDRAVIAGIKRIPADDGHAGTYYSPCDVRLFLGYTEDYTTDPIVWDNADTEIVETPPGFANTDHTWSYGLAIQWKGDAVRLYVDRIYIGEITCDNHGIDLVTFATPVPTEHKIGCIRWLQNPDTWFGADRCVGSIGQDNVYP